MTVMRKRERVTKVDYPCTLTGTLNGSLVWESKFSTPVTTFARTMFDQIGQTSQRMKPCSSDTLECTLLTFSEAGTQGIPSAYYNFGKANGEGRIGLHVQIPSSTIAVPGTVPLDTLQRAGADVYSLLRPKAQVLTDLVQLAQMKSLFNSIKQDVSNLVPTLRKLNPSRVKQFINEADKAGIVGAKGFLKGLSNRYLAFSFGVAPLIQTVGDVAGILGTLIHSPQVNFPVESYHGTATHTFKPTTGKTTVQAGVICSGTYDYISTRTVRVSSTLRVEWNDWDKSAFQDRFFVFANQIGLYSIFGTVFECVPFSFVADWIVPASVPFKWLDDSLLLKPSFNLLDSCHSVKDVTTTSYTCNSIGGIPSYPVGDKTATLPRVTWRRTTYTRSVPCILPSSLWTKVPGLNGRKVSYLGAMVLQRAKS